jgi:cytochrome c oxidase accessory protein FixG
MAKKDTSDFREHLVNVDKKGKRVWLYPKIITGKFYNWRTWFSRVLLLFLIGGPWLHFQGHPLFLFNVIERKFILFGIPFWPQDLYLIALGLLTFIVFIIAFTAVFGRVFCGWACPQTIFMEMVFRKIETWIEGSPAQQKKLNEQAWDAEKLWKKGLKNTLFWAISFVISNTFLAYIIGSDALIKIVTESPSLHIGGLVAIVIFTTVFYLVFARLRELVCIMICPYGRLQGVLMDPKSIVVAYDFNRGEPRGKIQKTASETPQGDCVDCGLCIDVCPTGIDIRNGTQLECVHCTACIDACDSVMDKIHKPRGLIRYASEDELKGGKKFKLSARVVGYAALWAILFTVFVTTVSLRKELQASLFRGKGSTYTQKSSGEVTNIFEMRVVNKTFHAMKIVVAPHNKDQHIKMLTDNMEVKPGEQKTILMLVTMQQQDIHRNSTPFELDVTGNGKTVNRIKGTFLGPVYE